MMFLPAAECVPFVVAVVLGEWQPASHYLFGVGVALIVGSLLRLILPSPGKLAEAGFGRYGLCMVCVGSFGVHTFICRAIWQRLDAVFEGNERVWTTTGCSLVQDIDHMSIADNTWRFTMQCIGGQGVVVIALSLGLFGRAVDSSLYSSEGRSEHVIPNSMQTARFIVRFSMATIVIGTILTTAACLFIGIARPCARSSTVFGSLFASFNTGGMTSMSTGIIYYHCAPLEIVIMVLILLGSINFTLHSEVWKGHIEHFFRDIEIRTLVVWLSVILVAFVATLCAAKVYDDLPTLLRRAAFTVVAAFSSTGFQTISVNQMTTVISSGALLIIIFCMAVGGSAGSTTGGIKVLRIGILVKELVAYIKDLLAPASARQVVMYYHVGRRPLSHDLVRANLVVLLLYGVAFLITTIVTVTFGYAAAPSMFESVSMVSNIGMSCGIIQPGMPDPLKVLYIVDMWAGRLEYVTLIALLVSIIASIRPKRRVRAR